MSRSSLYFMTIVTINVVAAATVMTHAGDRSRSGVSFGEQIAGTYIEQASIGFGPTTALHTLSAFGTHVATGSQSFGNGNPAEVGPQSPFHGAWEQTGPRQITLTTYILIFDPTGTFVVWARPTAVLDFDEDFETAEGNLTTLIFAPSQDPTDPEEMPLFVAQGPTSFKKVPVIDPCL